MAKKKAERKSDKTLKPSSGLSAKYFTAAAVILIPSIAFLLYSNILHAPFIFDDVSFTENPAVHISSLSGLFDILTAGGIDRRVGLAAFALNFYFGELDPFGYHLFNIIVHILNAAALFYLARLTLSLPSVPQKYRDASDRIAFAGSLLWLAHPVNIMAVTYTVQRLTSLSALFFLLSLISYILARQGCGMKRVIYALISVACGIMAFGTKQNTAVLPLVMLLYEFYFFREEHAEKSGKRILLSSSLAAAVFIALAFVYLGHDFLAKIEKGYIERGWTPYQRLISECRVLVLYLTLFIYPNSSRLNVDYDLSLSTGLLSPSSTLVSLLFLGGLVFLSLRAAKRAPLFSLCILWFFLNLAVESTIYPLDLVFEHRLYLPLMGLVMLTAGYILALEDSFKRKAGIIILSLSIILFSFWTYERNGVWKSRISLWEDNLKKSPGKARVHGNLGKAYLDNKEYEKARAEFEKVIDIDPSYIGAYDNLSVIYIDYYQQYDKAMEYINEAIKINPDDPLPYINAGVINLHLRQLPEAVANFEKALKADPESLTGHFNLAGAYFNMKEYDKALSVLKRGIGIWPADSGLHALLGLTLYHRSEKADALIALKRALQLDPNNGMALMYMEKLSKE
ncbi:MAG: tetratricopeptide repeat protein [Nitrospirae bacterium]|nr:tetratricopeptide repeat protein [Nitrospirota bacterium]